VEVLGQRWELLTVDTGQHYDYEMNALLYEQLGVWRPDLCLDVGSGDHAGQTAAVLTRAAAVFAARRPWAVVVIGDTNSTLGCALAAAKLRIPVVHVEAGLRADDAMMAEEINRRAVDAISAVLCAPSAAAEERLRAERPEAVIVRTGDVARDVLMRHASQASRASTAPGWPLAPDESFVFATLHRAELTSSVEQLAGVVRALGGLDVPVVLPAHPRMRATLARHALAERLPGTVHVLPPFGYLETLACVREARAVVTDSGGVQREAYWLGTPCLTVRAETEWHETVRLGANVLVPPERAASTLRDAVRDQIGKSGASGWDRDALGDGDAAGKVRDAIERLR